MLFLRRATPFRQLLHGGGQESQKRAGTENVAGIVGAATALEIAQAGIQGRSARVRRLRQRLSDAILARVPGASVNGCQVECLPNNLNISFDGIESDQLVAALDDAGYQGNQSLSERSGNLFANVVVFGGTLRAVGNRFAERGPETLLSLFTLAARMNDTSLNQGDHCIIAVDQNPAMTEVKVGNQVLDPGPLCARFAERATMAFKPQG